MRRFGVLALFLVAAVGVTARAQEGPGLGAAAGLLSLGANALGRFVGRERSRLSPVH